MITKDNILKVMELFLKHPERKFHLRELERLTKLSMPGVRKIVEKLEKEDLLSSKKEKAVKNFYASRNEKYTSLKRAYNLNSIFTSGLLNYLRDQYEEPEGIVLFGSYAKGEDISSSDIDICVITKKEIQPELSKFEKILNRKINMYEIQLKKSGKEFINELVNGIVIYGYLEVL